MKTKKCIKCKKTLSILNFYSKGEKSRPNKKDSHCKDCARLRYRERRLRNLEKRRDKDKKYYLRHREEILKKRRWSYHNNKHKHQARQAVKTALYKGLIVRPLKCEKCGSHENIEAHHHDYSKKLDVEWLCKKCHAREDFGRKSIIY